MTESSTASDVPPNRGDLLVRYRLWVLLLITLIGGAVRFATLDRPPLWGDEAFTYYRVSGDFQQLLDILQFDGFPPLHYEAYWLLGRATKLTPRVMRLIPATAGTLMIPAMYFLAVQIVRKKTALLAALFTCVSAYMMVYSHDAKMYLACWLFVTLHAGCLFWWLRRGRSVYGRIAWLSWIATGITAAGMHHSANLLLAIELVVVLTFPKTSVSLTYPRRIVLFIVGTAVVMAAPAGYFLGFNRIEEKVDEQGFAWGSETMWIEPYNLGRGPADLALFTSTAYLYSWEWPQKPADLQIDPNLLHGLMIAGVVLSLLLVLGMMPWRHLPSGGGFSWHLPSLWLACWIIPIGYGFYCASIPQFLAPWSALNSFASLFDHHWIALVTSIVLLAVFAHHWPVIVRYFAATILIVAVFGLFSVILESHLDQPWRGHEWATHYWIILTDWWRWITSPRFLIMLLAMPPVIAFQCSGDTARERALQLARLFAIALIVFLLCCGVWIFFNHRFNGLVARWMGDHRLDRKDAETAVWRGWFSVWMPRYLGVVWPAFTIAACALLLRLPTRFLRYTAILLLLGLNITQATARLVAGSEPPSHLIANDIAASQGDDSRTYLINLSDYTIGSPGSLSAFSHQTRYYLSQVSDQHVKPHDFKWTPPTTRATLKEWNLKLYTEQTATQTITDINGAHSLRRIILWECSDPLTKGGESHRVLDQLGPNWQEVSDRSFVGRDHWTWNTLWKLRRIEIAKR